MKTKHYMPLRKNPTKTPEDAPSGFQFGRAETGPVTERLWQEGQYNTIRGLHTLPYVYSVREDGSHVPVGLGHFHFVSRRNVEQMARLVDGYDDTERTAAEIEDEAAGLRRLAALAITGNADVNDKRALRDAQKLAAQVAVFGMTFIATQNVQCGKREIKQGSRLNALPVYSVFIPVTDMQISEKAMHYLLQTMGDTCDLRFVNTIHTKTGVIASVTFPMPLVPIEETEQKQTPA